MRTISPSEFVRRLKHGIVSHDSKVVWFLGAGCSVSSGVQDAATLTIRWLKELKYLETGDEDDLDDWAESRFPTYDRKDPAAAYIQVHEALFFTDQEQQREQETLAGDGQPGFGYATLAQLLTHEKWGERCNTVITTNFDDLAADSLYFYSQRKPQVLTHESFDRHVQVSDARPTIVKLYGDAHLSSEYLDGNRRLLRTDVKERLRALATECTLVFVGYGGRDDCILDLFEDMPRGAPSGGVYWVNDKAPGKSMADWLQDRRAVWAENTSFDDLMYLIRQEFQLGHPRIDRFDQILQKYDEQYRSLASKSPKSNVGAETTAPADGVSETYAAATAEAKAYPVAKEPAAQKSEAAETPEPIAAEIPEAAADPEIEVLEPATPDSLAGEPLVAAAVAMKAMAKLDEAQRTEAPKPIPQLDVEPSIAVPQPQALNGVASTVVQPSFAVPEQGVAADTVDVSDFSLSLDDDAPATASTLEPIDMTDGSLVDDVLELDEEIAEDDEDGVLHLNTPQGGESGSREKIDALVAAAVKAMATDSETEDDTAPLDMSAARESIAVPLSAFDVDLEELAPPLDGAKPQALAGRAKNGSRRSLEAEDIDVVDDNPVEIGPLESPTRLMRREDAVALDARFRAALADNPRDAMLLANYAQFLTVGRQDHDGAEHYFNRAIDADPQNDAALRLFATFLTEIRRDHDRAEDCYRLAIRANFESAETMCSYAEFLWHARGDFETAGECFQVAVDAAPRDAGALCRYAKFLRLVQRNDDAAYALLKLAAASGGTDPAPTVALAEFTASRRNEIDKAETTFQKALEVAGTSVPALTAAAQFHATYKGDLTRAEALFDEALAADPTSTDAMVAYSSFLHARRADPARAEKLLQRAMEIDPANARLAAAYAVFRDEVLMDDEGAEDAFRKAINLDPRDATVLTKYGRFLQYSRRKPNAAEDRLRKAATMDPRNPLALRSYGWFLALERDNKEEGERCLRRAVSASPSDADALGDLAEFLSKHAKNRDETEEMFRRAMAADGGNKRTLRRYARFMADAKGDPGAAEELYSKMLKDEPKDALALGGSAHSMLVQGRRKEGLALLEKAFDAAMGDEPRRRSIDLLLELWFYRYAFDGESGADAIKAAVWLVKEGAKVTRVDLGPVVSRALADDHAEPDILRELSRVVSGSVAPERLDRFNVA